MKLVHLTREELLSVLQIARTASKRDWIALLVTYWHGLRASELRSLRREDLQGGSICVRRLKNGESGVQKQMMHPNPLLDERSALLELYAEMKPNENLYPWSRYTLFLHFQKYARAAGLLPHKQHPHVLRHSIAMHSLKGGANIVAVQKWLGHQSLASTGLYLRITDDEAGAAIGGAAWS